MTHRERVLSAMNHRAVDFPAVEFCYAPVGYYEHGEKLNSLFEKYEGDFEPWVRMPIPTLPEHTVGKDGRYNEIKKDAWGVEWEYRVFGMMGHVLHPAISDPSEYSAYQIPPYPRLSQIDYTAAKEHKKTFPLMRGGGFSYLERLSALREFEDALVDLLEDGEEVNRVSWTGSRITIWSGFTSFWTWVWTLSPLVMITEHSRGLFCQKTCSIMP